MRINNKLLKAGKPAPTKMTGLSVAKDLRPSQLLPQHQQTPLSRSSKPPVPAGLKKLSFGAHEAPSGIRFGSPSSVGKASSGLSGWSNLLHQTASGGVSSALGGGLISAIGGLGGVVSGLSHLFGGGKTTPAPLARFELPTSQAQTADISSNRSGSIQGLRQSVIASSIYGGNTSGASLSAIQGQQQIIQTVKQALLNSSSLNDVIAEI